MSRFTLGWPKTSDGPDSDLSVSIVRAIRPPSSGRDRNLVSSPGWIFLRCAPFVPYPFCPRSWPSSGIINPRGRRRVVGDWPRARAGYNRERIKYGCAGFAAPGSSLSLGKWPARGFLNSTWTVGRISTVVLSLPPPLCLFLSLARSPSLPPSLDRSSFACMGAVHARRVADAQPFEFPRKRTGVRLKRHRALNWNV